MLKANYGDSMFEGNEKYHGYIKDLIGLLSSRLSFLYEIKIVNDSKHGHLDPYSSSGWNGMIGELLSNVRLISRTLKIRLITVVI